MAIANATLNQTDLPEIPYRELDYFFRKKHFFGVQKRVDHLVKAAFPERRALERAVTELQSQGVRNDEMYTELVRDGTALEPPLRIVSMAPFFVPIGLVSGAILGALVGIATHFGYLQFLSVEPFAHSFWQALQANSIVGAFVVGILALVFGMRLPEYQGWKYETKLPDGTLLLMVRTTNEADAARVHEVLERQVENTRYPEVEDELAA